MVYHRRWWDRVDLGKGKGGGPKLSCCKKKRLEVSLWDKKGKASREVTLFGNRKRKGVKNGAGG